MGLITAQECTAKALELEEKAKGFPEIRDSYRRMAAHWRDLARESASFKGEEEPIVAAFAEPRQ